MKYVRLSVLLVLLFVVLLVSSCRGDGNLLLPEEVDLDNDESWLGEAHPNPIQVNGNTTINFHIKNGESGIITIYDYMFSPICYTSVSLSSSTIFNWNGSRNGRACARGVYYYELRTETKYILKRLVIQ